MSNEGKNATDKNAVTDPFGACKIYMGQDLTQPSPTMIRLGFEWSVELSATFDPTEFVDRMFDAIESIELTLKMERKFLYSFINICYRDTRFRVH